MSSGVKLKGKKSVAGSEEITIDGARGEGGGQILRTALALSIATGRPLRIANIRANRGKPGLMRQHLTAVRAAQSVSGATVQGAELGSTALFFVPDGVRGGDYRFAVGTAGSATLVAQTVLPALMLADAPSHLVLEGGTHNPHAPPFEFLDRAFLPLVRRIGVGLKARLERPGFFPAGGGRFTLEVTPTGALGPIEILDRGDLKETRAEAVVANLAVAIAERELDTVANGLGWPREALEVRQELKSPGSGNVVMLSLAFEHVTEVFTGFGTVGVPAEIVAKRAVKAVKRHLASEAAIGVHLADQLLLPMALTGAGRFTTLRPSRHLQTHVEVLQQFLEIEIAVEQVAERLWQVTVGG